MIYELKKMCTKDTQTRLTSKLKDTEMRTIQCKFPKKNSTTNEFCVPT